MEFKIYKGRINKDGVFLRYSIRVPQFVGCDVLNGFFCKLALACEEFCKLKLAKLCADRMHKNLQNYSYTLRCIEYDDGAEVVRIKLCACLSCNGCRLSWHEEELLADTHADSLMPPAKPQKRVSAKSSK